MTELLRATYMLEHLAAEVTLQRLSEVGRDPKPVFEHGSHCLVCKLLLVEEAEEK